MAESIQKQMEWATETFFPEGSFQKFGVYSIPIDKIRDEAAGCYRPGPCRPPYTYVPPAYVPGAAGCGRRWKTLEEKYTKHLKTAAAR